MAYSAISNLSYAVKKEKYSYKGFIWRYADEYEGIYQLNKEECVPKTNAIKIAMYSYNDEFIRFFNSISEASRFVGVSVSPIYKCLIGRQKLRLVIFGDMRKKLKKNKLVEVNKSRVFYSEKGKRNVESY